ncbi:MAG: YbaB/EbfC family nucleoid-associated protein [Clostridia bacterium]
MGKFGGVGGGFGGNMQNLMKQAQKMQQDMLDSKAELAEMEVTASSGGGMVEVTMTCDKKIVDIKIKPEAVDPEDVEMLQDLIIAAMNEAQSLAEKATEEKMGAFAQTGLF